MTNPNTAPTKTVWDLHYAGEFGSSIVSADLTRQEVILFFLNPEPAQEGRWFLRGYHDPAPIIEGSPLF